MTQPPQEYIITEEQLTTIGTVFALDVMHKYNARKRSEILEAIRSRPAPSTPQIAIAIDGKVVATITPESEHNAIITAAREKALNEVSMILEIENESEEYKKIESLRTLEQLRNDSG